LFLSFFEIEIYIRGTRDLEKKKKKQLMAWLARLAPPFLSIQLFGLLTFPTMEKFWRKHANNLQQNDLFVFPSLVRSLVEQTFEQTLFSTHGLTA
jgi:hypothetical protein